MMFQRPRKTLILSFLPGIFFLLLTSAVNRVNAQQFDIASAHRNQVKIPFRLVRNMIIVQLKINERGPFNFILDTGAGIMIITDPSMVDSAHISYYQTMNLYGTSEGEAYEANLSSILKVDIPGLKSSDISAAVLKKDHFGLSNYAGMPIHGLLGYEFFKNLVVEMDFNDSCMVAYRRGKEKKFKNGISMPIEIEGNKPYLHACVRLMNGTEDEKKFIIDLGAGHTVSLENMDVSSILPSRFIKSNLGFGFNGPIDGYIGRISWLQLGKYRLTNLIASLPEESQSSLIMHFAKRDGNVGIGLLKKFRVMFDYSNDQIYLKPSNGFHDSFEHDMSGMEYYADGAQYNRIIVSRVEEGSPADLAGLKKDDELVSINMRPVTTMSMEDIDSVFKSKNGRSLLISFARNQKLEHVVLTLQRRI